MSDIAISVENVSKLYHIGRKASGSLRETISGKVDRLFHRYSEQPDETEFWALKDVSFEIKQGDIVGVIGKNGAGKSTLLKILSRITEPTSGRIQINGRVGSLLEVGTGFHPELSGRENIFLNGSILGMRRSEIQSKFDEIVDFSGIEKFIDTPVKRYSSGMYVRLAFAVAAHLEPEVLIIDEVLAVGDAEFQKKCLGKMQDVAGHGRTIIFVSHNMIAVQSLCESAIYLNQGSIDKIGFTEPVVNYYLNSNKISDNYVPFWKLQTTPDSVAYFHSIQLSDNEGKVKSEFNLFDEIFIELEYVVLFEQKGIHLFFDLEYNGLFLLRSFDTDADTFRWGIRNPGTYKIKFKLPKYLKSGQYIFNSFGIGIPGMGRLHSVDSQIGFTINESDPTILNKSYSSHRQGLLAEVIKWEMNK